MLTVQSLIAGDGYFAVVLGAWWQLRKSAHLLPHLRRGPSSFSFHPGNGSVSWIMAIIARLALSTIRRQQELTLKNAQAVGRAGVPDATRAPRTGPTLGSGLEELSGATVPIPVAAELRRTEQLRLQPRPRSSSHPMSQHAVDPPTCPLPVVGAVEPGQATGPVGPPVRPPHRGAA